MVKNGICLGGASKQNALFSEKCAPKTHPSPQSRIGHACWTVDLAVLVQIPTKNIESLKYCLYHNILLSRLFIMLDTSQIW